VGHTQSTRHSRQLTAIDKPDRRRNGQEVYHQADPGDRRRQIERGMLEHRLNADRAPDRTERFVLSPGHALILPAFTFHWVEGGDDLSIAAACLLTTEETRARTDAYRLSARGR